MVHMLQLVIMLLPLQHFLIKNFKHTEKLNYECAYTYHLDSASIILPCFLLSSINLFFLVCQSCRHLYLIFKLFGIHIVN